MKLKSKPFKQIDRDYIISSKELRKAMDLEGEIIGIVLHRGRSPLDKENNISPDIDTWLIHTTERINLE